MNLKKVLGPQKSTDGTQKNRKNEELYKYTEKITDTMRKRRLTFYGPLVRMNENRLTKKIFRYIMGLKAASKWVEVVKRDAIEVGITPEMDRNGRKFRRRVDSFKTFEEKPRKRGLKQIISEEEKTINCERMKRFLEEKRRRDRMRSSSSSMFEEEVQCGP